MSGCGGYGNPDKLSADCADSPRSKEGLIPGPMDVPPEIVSRQAALRAIARVSAKEAPGAAGVPKVWMTINKRGRVVETRLAESSGQRVVDSAAIHAVESFRFTPSQLSGKAICISIAIPVKIGTP